MIRINLLPFRAARKKENIKRQITVYGLVIVLLFTVMAYYFLQLNSTLSNLKDKEKAVRAELKTYQATVKKINQLEKKIKEINAGCYVFKVHWLENGVAKLTKSPSGEYYITELPKIANSMDLKVRPYVLRDNKEAFGVNTREELDRAHELT